MSDDNNLEPVPIGLSDAMFKDTCCPQCGGKAWNSDEQNWNPGMMVKLTMSCHQDTHPLWRCDTCIREIQGGVTQPAIKYAPRLSHRAVRSDIPDADISNLPNAIVPAPEPSTADQPFNPAYPLPDDQKLSSVYMCVCKVCGERGIHDQMRLLALEFGSYACLPCYTVGLGRQDPVTAQVSYVMIMLGMQTKYNGVLPHYMQSRLTHYQSESAALNSALRKQTGINEMTPPVDFTGLDEHICQPQELIRAYWHKPRECDGKYCRNMITRASADYYCNQYGNELFRCPPCATIVRNTRRKDGRQIPMRYPQEPPHLAEPLNNEGKEAAFERRMSEEKRFWGREWQCCAPCYRSINVEKCMLMKRDKNKEFVLPAMPDITWTFQGRMDHTCLHCWEQTAEGFMGKMTNPDTLRHRNVWLCIKHGLRNEDGRVFRKGDESKGHPGLYRPDADGTPPTSPRTGPTTNPDGVPPTNQDTPTPEPQQQPTGNLPTEQSPAATPCKESDQGSATTSTTSENQNSGKRLRDPAVSQASSKRKPSRSDARDSRMSLEEWRDGSDIGLWGYSAGDTPPSEVSDS